MPRRRQFKRRKPRRTKRRYRRGAPTTSHVRSANFTADRIMHKMRYHDTIQVNPAALIYSYLFNLIDLHDPDRTGVGHQPMGYTEVGALYNRYRVHACKWRVRISNVNTPVAFAVLPKNGSGAPVDYTDACEGAYSKSAIVTDDGSDIKTVSGYITSRRILGRPMIGDDRTEGVYEGAVPADAAVLALQFQSADGATNMSSLNIDIDLVYYVESFDRKQIAGS